MLNGTRDSALSWGHEFVGTEHLCFAILDAADGVPAEIFRCLGIAPESIRQALARRLGRGTAPSDQDPQPTPKLRKVLKRAIEDSKNRDQSYIGGENLLLSLLQEAESPATQALNELNVHYDNVASELKRIRTGTAPN